MNLIYARYKIHKKEMT